MVTPPHAARHGRFCAVENLPIKLNGMGSPPRYSFTYRPPRNGDGWQVELRQGQRTVKRWTVGTRVEAIAAAQLIRDQHPIATFKMCVLGEVNAWETGKGWLYSPTASHEESIRAIALDDMGEVVLMVCRLDETRFIRGARKFRPEEKT